MRARKAFFLVLFFCSFLLFLFLSCSFFLVLVPFPFSLSPPLLFLSPVSLFSFPPPLFFLSFLSSVSFPPFRHAVPRRPPRFQQVDTRNLRYKIGAGSPPATVQAPRPPRCRLTPARSWARLPTTTRPLLAQISNLICTVECAAVARAPPLALKMPVLGPTRMKPRATGWNAPAAPEPLRFFKARISPGADTPSPHWLFGCLVGWLFPPSF